MITLFTSGWIFCIPFAAILTRLERPSTPFAKIGVAAFLKKRGLGASLAVCAFGWFSRTIPPQITLPSWALAFFVGSLSPSLAFGWDVVY